MAKIVLEDGTVLDVKIEKKEDEYFSSLQKAIMIDDGLSLHDVWVYEFVQTNDEHVKDSNTFIDYYSSEEELTHEQIIYQMVKRGLGRFDIVIPHKAFVLDFD
jgi:hypothetical protein